MHGWEGVWSMEYAIRNKEASRKVGQGYYIILYMNEHNSFAQQSRRSIKVGDVTQMKRTQIEIPEESTPNTTEKEKPMESW